jgi:transcriptional regulator with XRE-family HTH domain
VPEKSPAENLIAMRFNAGKSQRGLAREVGVSVEVIKYAERGGRPRPQNMKAIADYFGVRVTDLWPTP